MTRTLGSRRPSPAGGRGAAPRPFSSAERFAERARARRRKQWSRVGAVVLAIALAGVGIWMLWFSTLLTVETVRVAGVPTAEQQEIITVAKVPKGQPLVKVDTDAITERVRSRLSVAEARTARSWPHAVVITVRPRTAALVLQNPQGQLEVVDATGVRFGTVDQAPADIPVVTAESPEGAEKGALKAALSLVQALPADLADQVRTIKVSSANLVTFTLGDVAVTWGGADEPARKVAILRALLKTGPQSVDVSAPDTPVTR